MTVDRPALLLALIVLPWFWWMGETRRRTDARHRTWLRLAIATALIVAASGPRVAMRDAPLTVVAVVDQSDSVDHRTQQRTLARVNRMGASIKAGDRMGVVVFGAEAAVEARPVIDAHLSSIRSVVPTDGSDIGAALQLAQAIVPREGARRIVLFSDGRETSGSADRAAVAAGDAGIPIDVVAPEVDAHPHPPQVARVTAPAHVRQHEPFTVVIDIEGEAGSRGRLDVVRDDHSLVSRAIAIPPGGTVTVTIPDSQSQAGTHVYRAYVGMPGATPHAEEALAEAECGAVVSVAGRHAVLYVSESGGQLSYGLEDAGFVVARISPAGVPTSPEALRAYDALVLDDVPPSRLTSAQASTIAHYVETIGGGLLLLGSARSLDPNGYPSGPLDRILPIDLRPRSGRRAPSLGLVLVLDRSGSMADAAGGTPKIELARQAVSRVIDVMPPTDRLGIIAFSGTPGVIAPLGPVGTADVNAITSRMRALEPAGPTRLAPAAELAIRWLAGPAGEAVSRRKVLLISDGLSSAGDVAELRTALRGRGVTLSAVAIGADANLTMLRELAESTGGRVYVPTDANDLPSIVAREAVRSAAGTVVTERFRLQAAQHPILAGFDTATMGEMGGYVVGTTRPAASTILRSHLGDPILASWRVGIGRVAVFTGDLGSAWSAPLRRWASAPRLWAQTVRWLSRGTDDAGVRVALADAGDGSTVVVEGEQNDGAFATFAQVTAVVRSPRGDTQEIELAATAPGRWEARIATPVTGSYVIDVSAGDPVRHTAQRTMRGFFWNADRERRFREPDLALLKRVAAESGGRMLSGADDSPLTGPRPVNGTPVWLWFAAAALAMFTGGLVGEDRNALLRIREWLVRRREPMKRDVVSPDSVGA